jgi:hypothetical protein
VIHFSPDDHMNVMPSSVRARGLFAAAALFFVFSAGCTRVAPYERGVLARPTMSPGSLAGPGEEHVYDVHEGATGGGTAGGGGCGCN